jgi:hypothetical protein
MKLDVVYNDMRVKIFFDPRFILSSLFQLFMSPNIPIY